MLVSLKRRAQRWTSRRCCACALSAAAQEREQDLHRELALLAQRLTHRRQRRGGEARLLDVVEADDRDLLGNAAPARAERVDRAQRHRVAGGDHRVDRRAALVEEDADRLDAGAPLEIADDDQLGVEGQAALGEDVEVDAIATLRLRVGGGAAEEGDATHAVLVEQVGERRAHPRGVVDEHARHPGERHRDAAHREGAIAIAVARQRLRTDVVPQGARHDDQPVDVLGPGEIVHGVALDSVPMRRAEHAAREADQVDVGAPRGVCHAGEHAVLVAVLEPVDEEAQRRASTGLRPRGYRAHVAFTPCASRDRRP